MEPFFLINRATLLGLLAAILLISALVFAGVDVLMPNSIVITVCGIAMTMGGLVPVIVAAFIVILEGQVVKRQIDDELRDVSELAAGADGVVAE